MKLMFFLNYDDFGKVGTYFNETYVLIESTAFPVYILARSGTFNSKHVFVSAIGN